MIGMCLQVDEFHKFSTWWVCSKHNVPAPGLVQGQHPQPSLSLKEEVIKNQLWLQEMPFLNIYTWSVLMRGLTCLLTSWDMFASSEMRQCFKNALSSCWELERAITPSGQVKFCSGFTGNIQVQVLLLYKESQVSRHVQTFSDACTSTFLELSPARSKMMCAMLI